MNSVWCWRIYRVGKIWFLVFRSREGVRVDGKEWITGRCREEAMWCSVSVGRVCFVGAFGRVDRKG